MHRLVFQEKLFCSQILLVAVAVALRNKWNEYVLKDYEIPDVRSDKRKSRKEREERVIQGDAIASKNYTSIKMFQIFKVREEIIVGFWSAQGGYVKKLPWGGYQSSCWS